MPGESGGLGTDVDGLEGFARVGLLAGTRLVGERGEALYKLASWWAKGVATGVDPKSDERWLRPSEHRQAVVEASSLALLLHFTKPWIWEHLSPQTREQAVEWFQDVRNPQIPDNNWIWFQIIVETFLRGVGAKWDENLVRRHLARHEQWYRRGGWISDGPRRCYDHYVGWAMETLPALWTLMAPRWDVVREFAGIHGPRLARYLEDVPYLVGADVGGSRGIAPLIQGRSLIYRWCTCAPLWAGVFMGVSPLPPGLTRRICSGTVRHFLDHGVAEDGILTMGWFGEFRPMAQFYSGVGSPYWASKGMLGLALPPDHPVWTEPEKPLPVELGDTHRIIAAPGWMASGTRQDGIVRVLNIGTGGQDEGELVGEAPLYTSLGFSTATAPPQAGEWKLRSVANVVGLKNRQGWISARSGQKVERCEHIGEVLIGQSSWLAHWVRDGVDEGVGYGARGTVEIGPKIVCAHVCHRGVEVRCVWVDGELSSGAVFMAGWPTNPCDGPESFLEPVTSWRYPRRLVGHQVTGLSKSTTVETLETSLEGEGPYIALVGLGQCGPLPQVNVSDGDVVVSFPGQSIAVLKFDCSRS